MAPLHHRRQLALLLLLAFSCSCLIESLEARSRDKEGRRRNDRVPAATSTVSNHYSSSYVSGISSNFGGQVDTTGFCTRRRDMKLMCYCTPDENHVPVQKAECWVFSEALLQNDTTWTRFYQQKRLRDLKFVVQNHGRLDYIPTMVLEPMKNLSSISIEYSQVEVIRSYAFANLPYLERIVLVSNQIMALDQDAFANHLRLRELNLEHNQIFEVDRHAFRNLPLCERLFLNNNNITSLHEGLFVEMARLVYLNLAHNQISVLTSEIFKGLGNLNVLKLTHNNLNFIGDTVFAELWSLIELELDDNRIERISERALDGLNNLKTLNLRNNLLKKIDNGLLRGTPALLSINVQSNELETLTFYTFQPIMDNLVNSTSELLLSENNFVCDCRLQWVFDLRNRTRHMQLRDALEDIVCTLQDPKLSNFVEPVPGHILSLLNVAGYSEGRNAGGRKRMSKSRQASARQSTRQTIDFGPLVAPEAVGAPVDAPASPLHKRSLVPPHQQSQPHNDALPLSNSAYDGGKQSPTLHGADYYEDPHTHGSAGELLLPQQADMEDELDLMKQNALFAQHDDALDTNKLSDGGEASKQVLGGIKVRLFTLRPENLPCQVALSDPTELPVSRDLVDSRSSVQNNSASTAAHLLQSLLAVILCTAFAIRAG